MSKKRNDNLFYRPPDFKKELDDELINERKTEKKVEKENQPAESEIKPLDTLVKTLPVVVAEREVSFVVKCTTEFGQKVHLVGNQSSIGEWDESNATPFRYADNFWWISNPIPLPCDQVINYKYVIKSSNEPVWEETEKSFTVPNLDCYEDVGKTLVVIDHFGSTESHIIHDKLVKCTFRVKCQTKLGESVILISGNYEDRGWNVGQAKEFKWDDDYWWKMTTDCAYNEDFYYKYAIKTEGNKEKEEEEDNVIWENLPNRYFSVILAEKILNDDEGLLIEEEFDQQNTRTITVVKNEKRKENA